MKIYKYITSYHIMLYAVQEFESVKPTLEKLYGKKIIVKDIKDKWSGFITIYYSLEESGV